jgi:hypothetical protein
MKNSFIFALKVWQTAVFAGPVLIVLCDTFRRSAEMRLDDAMVYFFFFIIYGMVFSAPSFLVLWLGTYLVSRLHGLGIIQRKIVLCAGSIALTLLPFCVLFNREALVSSDNYMFFCYALVIGASVWLYKLKPTSITANAASINKPTLMTNNP